MDMFLFSFLIAFFLSFVTTPTVARLFYKRGIVGVDLHKEGVIKVPEMGGVAILFAVLTVLIYHYLIGHDRLLAPIFAIFLIGIFGIIDGIIRLSAAQKIFSFYLVGIFLAWELGFKGAILYLAIGFFFMAAVNFTNMLAGFNGLEIGTGAIAAVGMSLVAYFAGEGSSFIISSTLAGALIAFTYYNRYPASVFPGDVGTLIIGAALFSSILLGNLYIPGLLIFVPYILDASLKFYSAGVMTRESQKPTIVKDGMLHIPKGSNLSLARLFLRRTSMTEKDVVFRVWIVEAAAVAVAVAYEVVI